MNVSYAALSLIALLATPAVRTGSPPVAGNCRNTVWLISELPQQYNHICVGDCAPGMGACTDKSQVIGTTTHYYCKCVNGSTVNPDSTACTTVVTHNATTGTWDHYCTSQGCGNACAKRTVGWIHDTYCDCP